MILYSSEQSKIAEQLLRLLADVKAERDFIGRTPLSEMRRSAVSERLCERQVEQILGTVSAAACRRQNWNAILLGERPWNVFYWEGKIV